MFSEAQVFFHCFLRAGKEESTVSTLSNGLKVNFAPDFYFQNSHRQSHVLSTAPSQKHNDFTSPNS